MTSIVRGRVTFVGDDDAGRSAAWLDLDTGAPPFAPVYCSRAERALLAGRLGDLVELHVEPAGGPEGRKPWPCF